MNDNQKLGKIEAIALGLTVISNNIIFNIPTIIFNSCGSGSWLNTIYISVLALIFILIFLKLIKPFPGQDIIDISKKVGGKPLKYIISVLYIVLFLSFSAVCLRYFSSNLRLIYYSSYNVLFIML